MQVYGLSMPITENGSLLFSSCHLELVISEIVNFLLLTTWHHSLYGTVKFTANNLKFFSAHDFSLLSYLGRPLASQPTQAAQKGKIMS